MHTVNRTLDERFFNGFKKIPSTKSLADYAALTQADEFDQALHVRFFGKCSLIKLLDQRGEAVFFTEEEFFVCILNCTACLDAKSTTLQAHEIWASNSGGCAIDNHVGWHVLHNLGAATHQRVFADVAELMRAGETGNDGVVAHCAVTAQGAVVR